MKQKVFNSFKDRLLAGKVQSSFNCKIFPINQKFFDTYNIPGECSIENYRTLDELNRKAPLSNVLGEFTVTNIQAWYGLEFLTIPRKITTTIRTAKSDNTQEEQEITRGYDGWNYYCSAQMAYHYNQLGESTTYQASEPFVSSNVIYRNNKFLMNIQETAVVNLPNGLKTDGTNIHFGLIPDKQAMIVDMAKWGVSNFHVVDYENFRGFLIADENNNLITYIDNEAQQQLESGAFVYDLGKKYTINNINYGTLIGVKAQ